MVVVGAVAFALVLVAAAAAVVLSAQAWARGLRDQETLPEGTVVAGADVGGMHVEQAAARVEEAVATRIDRPMTVVAGEQQWHVTPAELGARAQPEDAVRQALAQATSADPVSLAWARWFGGSVEMGVPVTVDEQQAADVVAGWAEEFNRDTRNATLTWSSSGVKLVAHHDARHLAPNELTERLVAAAEQGAERVEAPVSTAAASVTTDDVRPLLEPVRRDVDRALTRDIRVTAAQQQWTVSPADLGATPDLQGVVAARLDDDGEATGDDGQGPTVPLSVPKQPVHDYVHGLAEQVDSAGRDAQVRLVGERLTVEQPAQVGQTLQHDAATKELREAVTSGAERVELPVSQSEATLTAEDFDSALVLRQSERRLYHYVNGSPVADWRVAVGAGGSPTPTGVFTVGVKRHRPAWHNPDPQGWGADMPAMIEPGPTNPLGVRALNWHDDGRDTLIRFHGTAVTNSIGRAASQGCVRLTNDDIRKVYDRVPTGTPIVSLRR